jgi:hypothetical protein
MKRFIALFLPLLTTGALWAAGSCAPSESTSISSEARCVKDGGISIALADEEGAKVACMASKEVQGRCGPDGRITRLHAYTEWFNKLKEFEDRCAAEGGTFSYQNPNFIEPADESFCSQAVPEVGSNMFEESLCNYRSFCPEVTVVCERSCNDRASSKLF